MFLCQIKQLRILYLGVVVILLGGCIHDTGYRLEGGKVVYERPTNTATMGIVIVELDADPSTFEILGDDDLLWAKDKSKVFLYGRLVEGISGEGFYLLNERYGKNDHQVVCGSSILEEADAATFDIHEYTDEAGRKKTLGKDKNAIYMCGTRIPSQSVEAFRPIKNGFYRDNEHVYWGTSILPGAKVETFRILGNKKYGTDGERLYYDYQHIKDADIETFEVRGSYARDKNHNYYMGNIKTEKNCDFYSATCPEDFDRIFSKKR